MAGPRLPGALLDEIDAELDGADAALTAARRGEAEGRQPVHTFYVPADRAGPDLVGATRTAALTALAEHAPDSTVLAAAAGMPADVVDNVWPRFLGKLEREPVEDLRLDLEDGYGRRPDDEEDAHAAQAGRLLATLESAPGGPWCSGVRIKSFEPATRRRGIRSLDLVVGSAVEGGGVPPGFVVTLPKVTSVDQVRAMASVCAAMETAYDLPAGTLRFEVQVETPLAILGGDGAATVARAIGAADGRCAGLHYGTYDYSAALGIAAAYQSLEHPAADHAKAVMQVAAAAHGVRVCDGSSNVLPVGTRDEVHAAWALHARLVRRSLERGYYQGWDLHPAQLPTRYLATYAFYRHGAGAAADRLRAYVAQVHGGVLDEPATARALAGFLLRGLECGALDPDEVLAATEVDTATLHRLAGRAEPAVAAVNRLSRPHCRSALLAVCASRRWADTVTDGRPYLAVDDLLAAADGALAALDERDVDEALAGHPRIGEQASGPHAAASRREQSGVAAAGRDTVDALAAGNRAYEERFGHIYLVCASGRSAEELLSVLTDRLRNDPETERRVLREELGKINRLRLERLLDELRERS